jgi:glycerol-1-phosphate dehydrogenase [NAD(P)+]
MAPVFIDGVKRTLTSRYPDALISDLETLRDAPYEMTAAGVGDLLAAFISFPDWYLAHQLGMDANYATLPHALMGKLDDIFLAYAEEIRNRSLPGMAALAKLIHLGGLSMSLMHATAPLSGYEHVMSHTLDLINEQDGLPLAQHGSQVALAVVLCSGAYQVFFNEFEPAELRVEQYYPQAEQMKALILKEFSQVDPSGKAGEECWSDYRIKLENWSKQREKLEALLANWPTIRRDLMSFCRPPETILRILKAVDAPLRFAELNPPLSESAVKFAFFNSALTRRRLTLGDLLIFFQWDREALWEMIWKWAE